MKFLKTRVKTSFVLFSLISAFSSSTPLAHSGNTITLQPHQEASVKYLTLHPSQKGVLLFHSLGSGKTYIALDYAEKNPSKKVVIFLPDFLKSNWISQMKSFGVRDTSRYELVSLNETDRLLSINLSDKIVIVDEVHRLIKKMRAIDPKNSEMQIASYQKLQSAEKLILLTGTPIFEETTDIAFIANLLADGAPYPVDPNQFRTEYMRIRPGTSLVRGHFLESKLIYLGFPFVVTLGAVLTLGTALPWAIPVVTLVATGIVPKAREAFPVNQVSFREFDTNKWKNFAENYVSFYQVKLAEDPNYPKKTMHEMAFDYNNEQAELFLSLVDEDLRPEQIKLFLSDAPEPYSDSYLKIHSAKLQKDLLRNFSTGMEIGNIEFRTEEQELVESPKFEKILKLLKTKPGQVAVYSNYYENGIKRLARFFDRNGMKDDYVILTPEESTGTQIAKLEAYNQGKKRILLIHPEITEGISLVGTEHFHILEPIANSAMLDQIVGRAIRYRSHTHLPEDRRNVHVYQWEAQIEYSQFLIPTSAGLLRREHYLKNFSEVNPNTWTNGILELDSNYFLKDETPDQRVKRRKALIQMDIESFQDFLGSHSIERAEGLNSTPKVGLEKASNNYRQLDRKALDS